MSRTKRKMNPEFHNKPFMKRAEIAGDASCKSNPICMNANGPHLCNWSITWCRKGKRFSKRQTSRQQRRYYHTLTLEEIGMYLEPDPDYIEELLEDEYNAHLANEAYEDWIEMERVEQQELEMDQYQYDQHDQYEYNFDFNFSY